MKEELKKTAAEEQEEQQLQDKLMIDEDREIGAVGWNVWKSYFKYYGGGFYFFLIFFRNILYMETC